MATRKKRPSGEVDALLEEMLVDSEHRVALADVHLAPDTAGSPYLAACCILEANELKEMGDTAGAQEVLGKMLEADLRCLDAHAHLGNMLFRTSPHWALLHYEVGVRIGELSLGDDFDGVLAWGLIDNRPFLRCMQGYGLCLWRLERWQEAERVFERMLWLNPSDNQGIRGLLPDVRVREAWVDDEE